MFIRPKLPTSRIELIDSLQKILSHLKFQEAIAISYLISNTSEVTTAEQFTVHYNEVKSLLNAKDEDFIWFHTEFMPAACTTLSNTYLEEIIWQKKDSEAIVIEFQRFKEVTDMLNTYTIEKAEEKSQSTKMYCCNIQ